MIDLPDDADACVCISNNNPHESCNNNHTLEEKGQAITLKVKNQEEVKTIVVDSCLIDDDSSRCDGLFIFKDKNSILSSFLVELKNNTTLEKPIKQLDYTRKSDIYINLMNNLSIHERNRKYTIVACVINKNKLRKLENEYDIRIIDIVRKSTEPYPDLRKYLK